MPLPKHMQPGYRPGRKPLSTYERQMHEYYLGNRKKPPTKPVEMVEAKSPEHLSQLLEAMLADNRAAKEEPKVPKKVIELLKGKGNKWKDLMKPRIPKPYTRPKPYK